MSDKFTYLGFGVGLGGVTPGVLAFRVSGFGLQVSGLEFGFWVSGFGFRVSGFRFQVSGFGFRVSGFSSQVSGFRFRISGSGVSGLKRTTGGGGS